MTPSLDGCSKKAKEATSPHEVRPTMLATNTVFQHLGYNALAVTYLEIFWAYCYLQNKWS